MTITCEVFPNEAPRKVTKALHHCARGALSMDMQVEDIGGGITNVVLRGRLDTTGVGAIDLQFNAVAGARRAIVVDLSAVDFLTSLGIRLLVICAKAVKNKGGKLVLLSPPEHVLAVLSTAGIEQIIPVMFDRGAAIAAVQPV